MMDTYATATYLNHIQSIYFLLFEKLYIRDLPINLEEAAVHAPAEVIDLSYLAREGILVDLPKDRISRELTYAANLS